MEKTRSLSQVSGITAAVLSLLMSPGCAKSIKATNHTPTVTVFVPAEDTVMSDDRTTSEDNKLDQPSQGEFSSLDQIQHCNDLLFKFSEKRIADCASNPQCIPDPKHCDRIVDAINDAIEIHTQCDLKPDPKAFYSKNDQLGLFDSKRYH